MKGVLPVAILLVVVCVVLFFAGIVSPRRSKKMQGRVDDLARRGEQKGSDNGGRLGDLTRGALQKSRRASNASARAGRRVRKAGEERSSKK